jgi:hypothetical protein
MLPDMGETDRAENATAARAGLRNGLRRGAAWPAWRSGRAWPPSSWPGRQP